MDGILRCGRPRHSQSVYHGCTGWMPLTSALVCARAYRSPTGRSAATGARHENARLFRRSEDCTDSAGSYPSHSSDSPHAIVHGRCQSVHEIEPTTSTRHGSSNCLRRVSATARSITLHHRSTGFYSLRAGRHWHAVTRNRTDTVSICTVLTF